MAHILSDRVAQRSTTTGTGALTLSSTPDRYRSFGAVMATNDTMDVAIVHRTANEWEICTVTMQAGGTLSRGTPYASSNANAAVSFSGGEKDVFGIFRGEVASATYARLKAMATSRILGRSTAGTGDAEELTLSQVLDMIGSAARGDILYRGATTWQRLAKGAEGTLLTMGANDPAWSALPSGLLVKRSFAKISTVVTVNASIAQDNSIPQNTEGVEVLTLSHTPLAANNKLLIRANMTYGSPNSGQNQVMALFRDSVADAMAAVIRIGGAYGEMYLEAEYTAPNTSSITFKMRAGINSGTLYVNGDTGGTQLFNGVAATTLVVEEIKA